MGKKIKHGTVSGYKKENRMVNRGELDSPCPACKEAWAAYYRTYHSKTKAIRYVKVALEEGGLDALTPWQQAWLFGYASGDDVWNRALRDMVDGDHTLVEEIVYGD